jgi:hypothetical protein
MMSSAKLGLSPDWSSSLRMYSDPMLALSGRDSVSGFHCIRGFCAFAGLVAAPRQSDGRPGEMFL